MMNAFMPIISGVMDMFDGLNHRPDTATERITELEYRPE